MFPKFTFVFGGAASGKSAFAEQLVVKSRKPRTYLATSQIFDDEMQSKVERHIAQRGTGWHTIEEPLNLGPPLSSLPQDSICLIDCATMWLTNHLMTGTDMETAQTDLMAALLACPAHIVVVSNEVGHGIVPDNALSRQFREAQGRLNIALAAHADLAILVAAGLPMALKGELP